MERQRRTMSADAGQVIFGFSHSGKKFRPSDWIERLASVFASFDTGHRLRYDPSVIPMKVEGQPCLFVADSLAQTDPAAFSYLMDFARSNELQIRKKPGPTDQSGSPDVLTAA